MPSWASNPKRFHHQNFPVYGILLCIHFLDWASFLETEATNAMDSTIGTGEQHNIQLVSCYNYYYYNSQRLCFFAISRCIDLLIFASCNHVGTSILEGIVAILRGKYPQLTINHVPVSGSAWVVVHRPNMDICSPDHPPTYDPHMTLTLANNSVVYDFRALSQSIDKGLFSWDATETHLNTLKPYSGYTLCPGIKDYPAAVHFESKHHVQISLPYERHQSDGCRLWHVAKNRQHQPESELFNVCEPCKSLHNQLETLRKRHEKILPGKRAEWKHPSSRRPLKYCSPRTGIYLSFLV